jgi:hypothetical protein
MIYRSLAAAAMALVVGACASNPFPADGIPQCGDGGTVYLPPGQGPADAEAASREAIQCVDSAVRSGKEVILSFVLLGVEGQEFDAVLRTHLDGTVDFFQELEGAGSVIQYACTDFGFEPPGVPVTDGCSATPPSVP